MHFLKSSLSFTRFKVVGNFSFAHEDFQKSLIQNSFRDLSELPDHEESVGWVSHENCLEEPDLSLMLMEPYIRLTFRLDKRKIPAALLEAHFAIEERATLAAEGKERLSLNRRRELKRQVKTMLMMRTSPNSSLYRALWNYQSQTCLLFATGKGLRNKFDKLFLETFGLELMPMSPWSLADEWAKKNNVSEILQETEPVEFNE